MEHSNPNINSIAIIGNYLPRKCGIATFTSDLVKSFAEIDYDCLTIAMNDKTEGYNYPSEVQFEINQDKLSDYRTAAEFLNTNEVDVVLLQHEFGIFGGPAGEHILTLLSDLKLPVVTTLHTVLTDPTRKQLYVMQQLDELTDRFVVMSKTAIEILHSLYDISRSKIDYIPHGIPDMPFGDPNFYKQQFNLLGRKVLLTFGLLSENKGIEYVIKSLPEAVKQYPDLSYVVLGATHPNVVKTDGEKYRDYLHRLVSDHGLENHVTFKNKFVSFDELCDYLSATDLYITPYVKAEQITSGTLAYAAGMGKAIISTPYWYAKEMLSAGRGQLVPFEDEVAMSGAIINLFEDEVKRHSMRKRSYEYNRHATWKEVARQYMDSFKTVRSAHNHRPRPHNAAVKNAQSESKLKLTKFNINHLEMLTDSTGILQHAKYTIPNRDHGYCTDDNARALIVALKAQKLSRISGADSALLKKLINIYFSFLLHAFNSETGRFHNFMSYSRQWLEEGGGSDDSHGRALWAVGTTTSLASKPSDIHLASTLFMNSLPGADDFQSPRSIAFTMLGIDAYLSVFSGNSIARRTYSTLSERLLDLYKSNATNDWVWPENLVTYSNGKLPHALILAGETLGRNEMKNTGLKSLQWLLDVQLEHEHLTPIGNEGWHDRKGTKARFDQQPVEAQGLIEACVAANQITGNTYWLGQAKTCFNWFLGSNDLNLSLYNPETGGCRDGLHVDGVNLNEGAESTLAWLLSQVIMQQLSENNELAASDRQHQKRSKELNTR